MPSQLITTDQILAETLMYFENNLVMSKQVNRTYASKFAKDGNKIGSKVKVRRPVVHELRSGKIAAFQDSVEGYVEIAVDKVEGFDLRFDHVDLTLTIDEFSDRYIKNNAIKLANKVDADLHALAKTVPNWVSPGGVYNPTKYIKDPSEIALAEARLANLGCEGDMKGVLSVDDAWALSSHFTSTANIHIPATDIYRDRLSKARLNMTLSDAEIVRTSNVGTHRVETMTATAGVVATLHATSDLSANYADVADTMTMDIKITGGQANKYWRKGDIITLENVFAVNPITKVPTDFLRQFVVMQDVQNAATTTDPTTLKIYPAILPTGPYQNVSKAPVAGDDVVRVQHTADGTFRTNMIFHPDAFALTMVPLELPTAGVKAMRKSFRGISMLMTEQYDITNMMNRYRVDILYGVTALQPDWACRFNGTK